MIVVLVGPVRRSRAPSDTTKVTSVLVAASAEGSAWSSVPETTAVVITAAARTRRLMPVVTLPAPRMCNEPRGVPALSLLETVGGPEDLRRLPAAQLPTLAAEIRDFLIEKVSRTGGHLGPSLGVVEI